MSMEVLSIDIFASAFLVPLRLVRICLARSQRLRVIGRPFRRRFLAQAHLCGGIPAVLILHGSVVPPRRIDVRVTQHVGHKVNIARFII